VTVAHFFLGLLCACAALGLLKSSRRPNRRQREREVRRQVARAQALEKTRAFSRGQAGA
jgi:hypothetical protein